MLLQIVLTMVVPALQVADSERRALEFLSREVPRWSSENKCFSCHNNGDGARALYAANRLGRSVANEALADTTRWVTQPERWNKNGGEGPYSDKVLAHIHFAATLVEGMKSKSITDSNALTAAAEMVARGQDADGSWAIEAEGTVGSPATYGRILATVHARRVLHVAEANKYRPAIERADRFLRECKIETVTDAAAVMLAVEAASDRESSRRRIELLSVIRKGESPTGGWGPYVHSPPEAFDTALVLLALSTTRQADFEHHGMISRGRAHLISAQQRDGSWLETTRPSGGVSYAQRLSTTGWATQALLLTNTAHRPR